MHRETSCDAKSKPRAQSAFLVKGNFAIKSKKALILLPISVD